MRWADEALRDSGDLQRCPELKLPRKLLRINGLRPRPIPTLRNHRSALLLRFLKQALELDLLLRGERLLEALLAVGQDRAVVLPEIVQGRFHLFGLGGREVEILLQALESGRLALEGLEGRGALPAVNAEIHGQRANHQIGRAYA